MKLTELKDQPLRFIPKAGNKSRKYDGSMTDFKADISRTHGVVKKKTDETKIIHYVNNKNVVVAIWDPMLKVGTVFFK